MHEITHREYLMWMQWLDEELERPTKSDHYLMQIAQQVARLFKKQPGRIQLKHFKLSFRKKQRATTTSKKEAATQSKARWFWLTGFKGKE